MSKKNIDCIYCGKNQPSSKEHILQANLGGNLTTQLVCERCNSGFSAIDQSLGESSLLALTRVGATKPLEREGENKLAGMPVQLGGEIFTQNPNGMWTDVKVVNQFHVVFFPQIQLIASGEPGTQFAVIGSDKEELQEFFRLLDKRISNGTLATTHIKTLPEDKCVPTRLVGHRSSGMYVRAKDSIQGEQFLKVLAAGWGQIKSQMDVAPLVADTIPAPKIEINMRVRPDDNYRAVAKFAFNYLAHCCGAEFVCRPEFDPIRNYIRGIELIHDELTPEDGVHVDTRFVRMVPMDDGPLISTGQHAIALTNNESHLIATLTLYRQFSFVVLLAEIQLDETLLFAHEFSTDRSTNEPLDPFELSRRVKRE